MAAVAAAVTASAMAAAGAHAQGPVDLEVLGCIADPAAIPECSEQDGLAITSDVAVSPDGANVYVTARNDHALVVFDRDPGTGLLAFSECFQDTEASTDLPECTDNFALEEPIALAVSPDGAKVVVVTEGDHSYADFDRSAIDGTLSFNFCREDDEFDSGLNCVNGDALHGPRDVEFLTDSSGFIVTAANDAAVNRFAYNVNGDPVFAQCLQDKALVPGQESGDCSDLAPLANVGPIAVDPAGDAAAVAVLNADAIIRFGIGAGGALAIEQCFEEEDDGAVAAHCAHLDAIESPGALAYSADGASLYAAGSVEGLIRAFDVGAGGGLTPAGCLEDETTATEPDCPKVPHLAAAEAIAVSPDGLTATLGTESTLVTLRRAPDGQLSFRSCLRPAAGPTPACQEDAAASGISGLAFAGNDHLYAATRLTSRVLTLSRTAPDVTAPVLRLRGPRKQSSARKVILKARANEDVELKARAKMRFPRSVAKKGNTLGPKTRSLTGGAKAKRIGFRFGPGVRRKVRKAFAQGKAVRVKFIGVARDAEGNRDREVRKVKLKR